MFTCEKVVEVLENIGVTEQQILKWERYYGLDVPHDRSGKKYYDEKHIKAFKQIKKYIALGYKEEEIKQKLCLWPKIREDNNIKSKFGQQLLVAALDPDNLKAGKAQKIAKKNPVEIAKQIKESISFQNSAESTTNPIEKTLPNGDPSYHTPEDNLYLMMLLERVMNEKDKLEKSKDYLLEQIHVLEMQKQEIRSASLEYVDQISEQEHQIEALEEQLLTNVPAIPGEKFVGSWNGKAKMIKLIFDTIGIDIPKERNKTFRVTTEPKRLYGNMAVFTSSFSCEEDPLWDRVEVYRVAYMNEEELVGELDVEYYVDDVPVAKAIYMINCSRKHKSE